MKDYKSSKVLLLLLFTIIISCSTDNNKNTVVSHKQEDRVNLKVKDNSEAVLNLGTFDDFMDTLNAIYDKNGGIKAVVDWTSKNLKKDSKIKFLTTDIDGTKKDMIITVSYILIEKLDSQGKETGKYYLGNPNQIDDKNSDMIFSYRDNFRNDKYNLVIYKRID